MQPPRFWDNPPAQPGWQARVLAPLSQLYAAGTRRRLQRGDGYRSNRPVVCVGNLHAGGTGKTPTVIALLQRLQDRGLSAVVVSRGYGGNEVGPTLVNWRHHSAKQVGDEPLLLSGFAPVIVSKDRAEGVKFAETQKADVIVLDDGFQNPSVKKDISLVVVDAAAGFGNGRVLPAGPLREPITVGLARGDLIVTIGDDAAQDQFTANWGPHLPTIPRQSAELLPLETGMDWNGLNVFAFAGIGRPDKFFTTLQKLGANLVRSEPLGDHQPLSRALMQRFSQEARTIGAQLVTTEKDAARLPQDFRGEVLTLPVRLASRDWSNLETAFDAVLESLRSK